jgi:hypothetical protein
MYSLLFRFRFMSFLQEVKKLEWCGLVGELFSIQYVGMEYLADSLPTLLGAISTAVPVMQSQHLHEKEMEAALELHRQAIRQAALHHAEEMDQEKALVRCRLTFFFVTRPSVLAVSRGHSC